VTSFTAVVWLAALASGAAETIPTADRRAIEVRTLNTPYAFTPYPDAEAWRARARFLREQVLVSSGLWPMPERHSLNAQVFGRIDRGDYSIEKVYFESHPGFYVTGNLYRPVGKTGPFPEYSPPMATGPTAARERRRRLDPRALHLARPPGPRGLLVDMVGYNDSRQVDHRLLDPRLASGDRLARPAPVEQHPLGGLPRVAP